MWPNQAGQVKASLADFPAHLLAANSSCTIIIPQKPTTPPLNKTAHRHHLPLEDAPAREDDSNPPLYLSAASNGLF
jgi:hypothetical protein